MRRALIVAVVVLAAGLALSCGPSKQEREAKNKAAEDAAFQARLAAVREAEKPPVLTDKDVRVKGPQGLEYVDFKVGAGKSPAKGAVVTVNFIGWVDGKKLDSSEDRGGPTTYAYDAGAVIPGWDVGITGMKEGGVRLLIIPPSLAYGNEGKPGFVGPDKTLWYRIELLKVVQVY